MLPRASVCLLKLILLPLDLGLIAKRDRHEDLPVGSRWSLRPQVPSDRGRKVGFRGFIQYGLCHLLSGH